MDAAARPWRPKTFSVLSPCTVSEKRAARRFKVCHWRFCTVRVARPISTMKIGIRGSVSSTVRPLIQSCHHITSTITGVAMTVSTSWGR